MPWRIELLNLSRTAYLVVPSTKRDPRHPAKMLLKESARTTSVLSLASCPRTFPFNTCSNGVGGILKSEGSGARNLAGVGEDLKEELGDEGVDGESPSRRGTDTCASSRGVVQNKNMGAGGGLKRFGDMVRRGRTRRWGEGATVRAPSAPRNLTFVMTHERSTFSSKVPASKLNPQIWQVFCLGSVRDSQSGQCRPAVLTAQTISDDLEDRLECLDEADVASLLMPPSKGDSADSVDRIHEWIGDSCEACLPVSRLVCSFFSIWAPWSLNPVQARKPTSWSMR